MNTAKPMTVVACIVLASCVASQPAVAASETLKVFILAGQSNMAGHNRAHTMATLLSANGPKDSALAQLVFKKDSTVSKKQLDEALALGRRLNELTGGIGDPKFKALTDADQKAAAEAEAKHLKAALDAYKKEVVAATVVSDRVYISSTADGNKKSGTLSVGYGANDDKIGPEYGFGLSMAQKIEGPILIIKTSWGGTSLNYDFRPPSRPDFKTTTAYTDAKVRAAANLKRYEKNLAAYPQARETYKADLAAYEKQMEAADGKTRKKLRKPRKPREPRKPKPFDGMNDAGLNYRMMNEAVHKVLDNLDAYHPAYDPAIGYEIAGFVWFQGYNDQFNEHYRDNYKDNMVAFIKELRREYKVPSLPFVIGVLGTGRTQEKVDENAVSVAQRETADMPEFRSNVLAVESYTEYDLGAWEIYQSEWAPHYYVWELVGSDRPYHYLGSGRFSVRLGDAFATAVADLMKR